MEKSEGLAQQERLQVFAEKRKRQIEIENKKRQLEDDKRQLQHLKSKALRERWLLDGAPSAGPEQDEVKKQLEEDEAKTKDLEETISRLEKEMMDLETEGSLTDTYSKNTLQDQHITVKCHNSPHLDYAESLSDVMVQEVKGNGSPEMERPPGKPEVVVREVSAVCSPTEPVQTLMRAAMYSVEIKVERDKVTGETKVLSSNTLLPVDLSHQGVKVYEDEQKVVHEMNGENEVHQLSSSEVEELLHKADEVSMLSQTVSDSAVPILLPLDVPHQPRVEITGLEAKPSSTSRPSKEPVFAEASSEKPVTMVFMGYQSVEDEEETQKVLGLEGTVKAELVLIQDGDGRPSPGGNSTPTISPEGGVHGAEAQTAPPNGSTTTTQPTSKPQEPVGRKEEKAGEPEGDTGEVNSKEKQPCKCCSIM
ncbi:paralemmin 1a [Lampris incognitus]|uniref:paralemmin 1a n=1 Tax=Lampris incognitus TaxID=2546036 RepID=UPI0024B4E3A1|nr:paralemmin 1a [Lampris incognitus]